MAKYDWEKIRADYETGLYTIKELADKYGDSETSYDYFRQVKIKQGWEVNKETHRNITEEANKKAFDEGVEREVELREEYQTLVAYIRRGMANELSAQDEKTGEFKTDFERLKQLKISSQILTNCRREDWELNKIKETAKQVEQEITGKHGDPIEIKGIVEEMTDEQQIAILKAATAGTGSDNGTSRQAEGPSVR